MKLIVDISDELHSKLKHKAIDQKTTLRDLVNQALEKLVKWLDVQIQNVARCMWETTLIALTVILQYQEKKRGLKFEFSNIKKTWMDFN